MRHVAQRRQRRIQVLGRNHNPDNVVEFININGTKLDLPLHQINVLERVLGYLPELLLLLM